MQNLIKSSVLPVPAAGAGTVQQRQRGSHNFHTRITCPTKLLKRCGQCTNACLTLNCRLVAHYDIRRRVWLVRTRFSLREKKRRGGKDDKNLLEHGPNDDVPNPKFRVREVVSRQQYDKARWEERHSAAQQRRQSDPSLRVAKAGAHGPFSGVISSLYRQLSSE
ncbi:hypothetical protein HPB52_002794 [Rhipicephalus sanguineus]|uniref:Uncharacterized protein n=1 Tax=Rhipicephalus sanguineus TaxID=34632 RepID=A0A9D4Q9M3_RHISA|nr:hypothetical protein HPB52_002794 [Rhipicephalus sanguineus]